MIQQKPNRFKRWIDAAPEILEAATAVELSQAGSVLSKFIQTQATALVAIHADGFVVVFGDRHLQVKILNLPVVSTIENERRLEELLESVLPRRYQRIYFPGFNLRATGNIRRRSFADVNETISNLELLYSIGESKNEHYPTIKSKQLAALEA